MLHDKKYVLVGHDCEISDYCVLGPRIMLDGDVKIGENTYIGTGASIRNGITIGKNVIVGIGAVVVGNSAKFVRRNESHRVFGKM